MFSKTFLTDSKAFALEITRKMAELALGKKLIIRRADIDPARIKSRPQELSAPVLSRETIVDCILQEEIWGLRKDLDDTIGTKYKVVSDLKVAKCDHEFPAEEGSWHLDSGELTICKLAKGEIELSKEVFIIKSRFTISTEGSGTILELYKPGPVLFKKVV
ncbi:MAG: hypothetical protein Q7S12_01445 [bacterium]|nr:hypothetical protein [bacterium]